jgi:uncharacterized RDD family membrane protein YckC
MAWYYVLNGASLGPIAETEIRQLRAQNIVALDTPVWTDGMPEWVPFSNSPLATAGALTGVQAGATSRGLATEPAGLTVTSTGATHTCVECGKLFPEDEMLNYEGSWVCAACKPMFFQRIKEGVAPKGTMSYATVGRRFAAVFIDGIIIDIVVFPLIILLAGFNGLAHKGLEPGTSALIYAIQYLLPAAYEIILVGTYGATLGKMAMKIKIVTPEGGPISYGRATGRYFGKMLSGIILGIGYFMAIWDDEKRALHDRICKTRVINDQSP